MENKSVENRNKSMGNRNKSTGNRNNLKTWRNFMKEEDGMGTVEVILIIVVLVGLVIIFKNQIGSILDTLFDKITRQTNRL